MNKPTRVRSCLFVIFASTLFGCASVKAPDERDPWESFNRGVYTFNDGVDTYVARPVAETYVDYVPSPVQTGVSNFFSNLDDINVIFNDLLQLKMGQFTSDFIRFSMNSVFGIFGLIDIASEAGIPKHNEDFGQTLGYWGAGTGPYLVLPFLGPSNIRDGTGLIIDGYIDPLYRVRDNESRWGLILLRAVDTRAQLLSATDLVEKSGVDPYVFVRNAYLQRRQSLVHDGKPPTEGPPVDTTPTEEDLELRDALEQELLQEEGSQGK